MPTHEKNSAVIAPWLNICKPAPVMPVRFIVAKPIETSPMGLTDENPITYLKSRCRNAINAPYTTLTKVSKIIHGKWTFAPSGKSCTPTRSAAYAPNFISTPAWIIETAVGAATCPSGLQLWNGNRPASTPKPINTIGNHRRDRVTPKTPGRSKGPVWPGAICAQRDATSRCEKSKLYACAAGSLNAVRMALRCAGSLKNDPAAKYITSRPTSASTDPIRMYRVSFMAAYSRVATQPHVAMSRYMGKIDNSYQKNSRNRSSDTNTPYTPATNSSKNSKNSRVRSSMRHEIRTPQNAARPVSSTIGAVTPSTPM